MAGPTYGVAGSYLENDTSGPSFGAPSGVVADSVVVIAAYVDGTGDPAISMASGWAHAPGSPVYEDDDPLDGASQNHRLVIAWHRASGSESGPFAPWTTTGSRFTSGQAHRFDGCPTSGDPFDTADDVAGRTVSATATPSVAITTGGADELVLHAATNWAGGPWTPASGFTERQDGGSFHHCMLAEKAQASAGSTGSVVATATGSDKSQAWLGALLPAVSILTADSSAATTASPSATANTAQPASTSSTATTASASGTATVSSPAAVSAASTAAAASAASADSPANTSASITASAAGTANTAQPATAAGDTTVSASVAAARGDTAAAVHTTTASITAAGVVALTVAASASSTASTSASAAASSPAASVASVIAHVIAVASTGQATPGRLTATNARWAALTATHT